MNKNQKGFILPIVIAGAVLLTGSGIYTYGEQKDATPYVVAPIAYVVKSSQDVLEDTSIEAVSKPQEKPKAVLPSKPKKATPPSLPSTPSPSVLITLPPQTLEACKKAVSQAVAPIDLNTSNEGITTVIDKKYYSVFGSNEDDILSQIIKCGPDQTDKNTLKLNTEQSGERKHMINWTYATKEANSKCEITNIKVGLHIVYLMPKWEKALESDTGTALHWQRFIDDLWNHEYQHGKNSAETAKEINAYLNSFNKDSECSNSEETIDKDINRIIKKYEDNDRAFDDDTHNVVAW